MSLLNDALRKKDREMRPALDLTSGAFARQARRSKQRRRYWIAGIGSMVLLVLGLGVGLSMHSIEAPSASILETASGTSDPAGHSPATPASPVGPRAHEDVYDAGPEGGDQTRRSEAETHTSREAPEALAAVDPEGDPLPPSPAAYRLPNMVDTAPGAISTPEPETSGPNTPGAPPSRDAPREDRREDPPADSALVERYYRKALAYHRQGRTSRAIALYRDALQLQPQHFEARFNLVSAYIDGGEFDHAHRIAQALHREDGANPQVLTNLAIAKIGMGQFREALELLDQAADMPPGETFTVLFHKGIACRGLEELDAAIGWYRKAADLNPDHPQLLFNLALAHDRRQDYATALHYYQAYRERSAGSDSQAQNNIRRRMSLLRTYLAAENSQKAGEP